MAQEIKGQSYNVDPAVSEKACEDAWLSLFVKRCCGVSVLGARLTRIHMHLFAGAALRLDGVMPSLPEDQGASHQSEEAGRRCRHG